MSEPNTTRIYLTWVPHRDKDFCLVCDILESVEDFSEVVGVHQAHSVFPELLLIPPIALQNSECFLGEDAGIEARHKLVSVPLLDSRVLINLESCKYFEHEVACEMQRGALQLFTVDSVLDDGKEGGP